MDGGMDMKTTSTRIDAGSPTHLGPVARKVLSVLTKLPDLDRRHAIETVESAIRNRCEEMGAKNYVHEQDGVEYRLEARFQDGVPALCGQISLDAGATYIGEALISIVGMPQSKMDSTLAKANEGRLVVKDVVSFMTDDKRAIDGGHIDPEREKLWLQISYVTHDRAHEWPTWFELMETIR